MPMGGSLSQDTIFLKLFQKYLDEKDQILLKEKYNPAVKLFMERFRVFLAAIFRRLEYLA